MPTKTIKPDPELRRLVQLISSTPAWRVEDIPDRWAVYPPLSTTPHHITKKRSVGARTLATVGRELRELGWTQAAAEHAIEQTRLDRMGAARRAGAVHAAQALHQAEAVPDTLPVYTARVVGDDRYLPPGIDPDDPDLYYVTDVLIGEELAEKMLARNLDMDGEKPTAAMHLRRNRPMSMRRVYRLAGYAYRRKIKLSPAPIVFDRLGRLIDGQKRLMVVVITGIALPFNVCYNADPDVFDVLDTPQVRTGADTLYARNVPNAPAIAAALRIIYLYDNLRTKSWHVDVPNFAINELYDAIGPGVQAAFRAVQPLMKAKKSPRGRRTALMISASATAAYYLAARQYPHGPHAEFVRGLAEGTDLPAGDVRHALRRYLLGNRDKELRRRSTRHHVKLYLDAWNLYAHGKPSSRITWQTGDPLPELITGPPDYA